MPDLIAAIIVLPVIVGLILVWYYWPRKRAKDPVDRLAYEELLYEINRRIHGAMDEIGLCPMLKTKEDSIECFQVVHYKLYQKVNSDSRLMLETKRRLLGYLARKVKQQIDRKKQLPMPF